MSPAPNLPPNSAILLAKVTQHIVLFTICYPIYTHFDEKIRLRIPPSPPAQGAPKGCVLCWRNGLKPERARGVKQTCLWHVCSRAARAIYDCEYGGFVQQNHIEFRLPRQSSSYLLPSIIQIDFIRGYDDNSPNGRKNAGPDTKA